MTIARQHFDALSNDPVLIRDPHDSACTPSWDDRTTDNQARCAKLYREIVKRTNVHWVIKISLKNWPPDGHGGLGQEWPHIIYPLEFNSQRDAWDYMTLSPDPNLRPSGFKSMSVETIRKPKPKIHEPRVRHEKLVKAPKPRRKP